MARGNNPVTGAASFYGLGWNVEFGRHGLSWGHAGAFSVGARTLVTIYPEAKLGIVVLTNAFPTGVPEGLADSFFDVAFDGKISKDWLTPWNAAFAGLFGPAVEAAKKEYAAPAGGALPAAPLKAYEGRYANAYIGAAEVAAVGDKLELRLGPQGKARFPLTHFNRDVFIYLPDARAAGHAGRRELLPRPGRHGTGGNPRGSRRFRARDAGAGVGPSARAGHHPALPAQPEDLRGQADDEEGEQARLRADRAAGRAGP